MKWRLSKKQRQEMCASAINNVYIGVIEELWSAAINACLASKSRFIHQATLKALQGKSNNLLEGQAFTVKEAVRYLWSLKVYFYDLHKENSSLLRDGLYYGAIEAMKVIEKHVQSVKHAPQLTLYASAEKVDASKINVRVVYFHCFKERNDAVFYQFKNYAGAIQTQTLTSKDFANAAQLQAIRHAIGKATGNNATFSIEHQALLTSILIKRHHIINDQTMNQHWARWLRQSTIYLQLAVEGEEYPSQNRDFYAKHVETYIAQLRELKVLSAEVTDINEVMLHLLREETKRGHGSFELRQCLRGYFKKVHGDIRCIIPEEQPALSVVTTPYSRYPSTKTSVKTTEPIIQEEQVTSQLKPHEKQEDTGWSTFIRSFFFSEPQERTMDPIEQPLLKKDNSSGPSKELPCSPQLENSVL